MLELFQGLLLNKRNPSKYIFKVNQVNSKHRRRNVCKIANMFWAGVEEELNNEKECTGKGCSR